jgi:hypothetical protein
VPGTSGNAGGRPKPPDGLRTGSLTVAARGRAPGELLDSSDEAHSARSGEGYLDRHPGPSGHPGRPNGDEAAHPPITCQALIEVGDGRVRSEPLVLGEMARRRCGQQDFMTDFHGAEKPTRAR